MQQMLFTSVYSNQVSDFHRIFKFGIKISKDYFLKSDNDLDINY